MKKLTIGLIVLVVACNSPEKQIPKSKSLPEGYCLAINSAKVYAIKDSLGRRLGRDVIKGDISWTFGGYWPYVFNDSNSAKEALFSYLIESDTVFNCVTSGK